MSRRGHIPRQTPKQNAKIFLRKSGGCESGSRLKMRIHPFDNYVTMHENDAPRRWRGKRQRWLTIKQLKSDNKTSHKTCVIADCINRIDNCPELCSHEFLKDGKLCKKLEKLARRADKEFYKNRFRFACSEHFLLTNYRRSLTGRWILILVSSVFKARKNTIDTVEESHRVKRQQTRSRVLYRPQLVQRLQPLSYRMWNLTRKWILRQQNHWKHS